MLELLILSLLVNAGLGLWVFRLKSLVDRVHPRFLQAAERRATKGVAFRKKAKK
jgi:hypothetical protein